MKNNPADDISRREFLEGTTAALVIAPALTAQRAQAPAATPEQDRASVMISTEVDEDAFAPPIP